jgi:hypothetical protein
VTRRQARAAETARAHPVLALAARWAEAAAWPAVVSALTAIVFAASYTISAVVTAVVTL